MISIIIENHVMETDYEEREWMKVYEIHTENFYQKFQQNIIEV